jgi:hypothetical protein
MRRVRKQTEEKTKASFFLSLLSSLRSPFLPRSKPAPHRLLLSPICAWLCCARG